MNNDAMINFDYTSLTEEEKGVYDMYKSSDGLGSFMFTYDLNKALRLNKSLSGEWNNAVNVLNNLIKKNISDEDITLYRATFEDCINSFITNNTYVYPAFMSTAKSINLIIRHFSGTSHQTPIILEIECPKGTPMLPMDGNKLYGHSEGEMLLGTNSTFEVLEKRTISDKLQMNELMSEFYASRFHSLDYYKIKYIV